MKETKTIQTLASVSLIGGPLSLIIGGVLLSVASLVCGIIALVMTRGHKDATTETISDTITQTLFRQSIIGIAMSALALILNAASLAVMMPAMIDAVQTGDFSSLLGGNSGSSGQAASGGSGGAFGGDSGETGSAGTQDGRSSVWG